MQSTEPSVLIHMPAKDSGDQLVCKADAAAAENRRARCACCACWRDLCDPIVQKAILLMTGAAIGVCFGFGMCVFMCSEGR
jgi:hypothetical protein